MKYFAYIVFLFGLSWFACSHNTLNTEKTAASWSKILTIRHEQLNGQGAITGRVVTAKSDFPLPGTNVILKRTPLGDATDLYGVYKVSDVEPGVYEIEANFIGYKKSTRQDLQIEPNKAIILDFYLVEDYRNTVAF